MHTNGFQLPAAGGQGLNLDRDVFRYNRVIPYYTPDPCIRPNEGDMMCPPQVEQMKRPDLLPPAGCSTQPPGDSFAFYKVRAPTRTHPAPGCPVYQPCPPQIPEDLHCPRTNRAQPLQQRLTYSPEYAHYGRHSPEYAHYGRHSPEYAQYGRLPPKRSCDFPHFEAGSPGNYPVSRSQWTHNNISSLQIANPCCPHPYYQAPYRCRPVYNRKYLSDCPEQDGPPADTYTFL